jgi:hypothetical protein
MATPNDPNLPKKPPGGTPAPGQPGKPAVPSGAGKHPVGKPAASPPPGKPPVAGVPAKPPVGKIVPPAGQKPAAPAAAKPGEKPAVPAKPVQADAGKPGGAAVPNKPAASPAKPAEGDGGKKPAKHGVSASQHKPAPVAAGSANRTSGRRLGQVLIDLGYIDDDKLWEILDEAKSNSLPVGQVALAKGLITETQLLQALADQFSIKFLTAEELKPSPESLVAIPETVASVFKVLPLAVKEGVVTVAIGDPMNLPSLDDLRNMQGLQEIGAFRHRRGDGEVLPGQGRKHR